MIGNFVVFQFSKNFYNFLAQPNSLMTLDLSNTDCSLDQVSEGPSSHVVTRMKTLWSKHLTSAVMFNQFCSLRLEHLSVEVFNFQIRSYFLNTIIGPIWIQFYFTNTVRDALTWPQPNTPY